MDKEWTDSLEQANFLVAVLEKTTPRMLWEDEEFALYHLRWGNNCLEDTVVLIDIKKLGFVGIANNLLYENDGST